MEDELIRSIFNCTARDGCGPGTEQYSICERAIQFRGYSYRRSEELDASTSIDCSTLVSQSYWDGALIGVPFVAESQRVATSGLTIGSTDDMIPSDVVIKYESLEHSPDRKWNHVGLYIGKDDTDCQWLIESTGNSGVRLSRVRDFDPRGGIKRFTLSRLAYCSPNAYAAFNLAKYVPKFGRLGVRQYCHEMSERISHRGLDIFTDPGYPVYAIIDGIVKHVYDEYEDSSGVELYGNNTIVKYLMVNPSVVHAASVKRSTIIGHVIQPSLKSKIVYARFPGKLAHLHVEMKLLDNTDAHACHGCNIDGQVFVNCLYLAKCDKCGLPL